MKWLLNISTHETDLKTIGHDWGRAQDLVEGRGFDGYELYPVGKYAFGQIPASIVVGLHLRFFAILEPIWLGDRQRLLQIFGDEAAVEHFYGGVDKYAIIDAYREQLELAKMYGCEYVVFHASQCELEYVFDWNCPWSWEETIDLCAEIINEATSHTSYDGLILFENLWWPGSMRLDEPAEVDRLMARVQYPRCGIVLDTGHVLNKNQQIDNEREGIEYLLRTVSHLGEVKSLVRAVHLTRSLSAEYVKRTRKLEDPFAGTSSFWDRFLTAHNHINSIDQHDPFEDPRIGELFEIVAPDYLVFEFTYADMGEWKCKIDTQLSALGKRLWPGAASSSSSRRDWQTGTDAGRAEDHEL